MEVGVTQHGGVGALGQAARHVSAQVCEAAVPSPPRGLGAASVVPASVPSRRVNHSENSSLGPPRPRAQGLRYGARGQAPEPGSHPCALAQPPASRSSAPLPGTKSRARTGHVPSRSPGAAPVSWRQVAGSRPARCPDAPRPRPQASEDCESVGHCPSCQRLFMILLLKGVPFTLTTVDTRR